MKIAISTTGNDLDSKVEPRFGRSSFFLLVETETMGFQTISNTGAAAAGGAGIQTAQFISSSGVEVVITGNVGPNAFMTLGAAGIKVFTGASGSVRGAVKDFLEGKLSEASAPTASSHSGMGGGKGAGMGRSRRSGGN